MIYTKKPYTKLHHVETRPNDDGSVSIEAHLMHHPPAPVGPDGKPLPVMAMPFAMGHAYANRKFTVAAENAEEAAEMIADIKAAHRNERGRAEEDGE